MNKETGIELTLKKKRMPNVASYSIILSHMQEIQTILQIGFLNANKSLQYTPKIGT